MFSNTIKTAYRKLWRNKQFSLINLLGLSIGMAVFFIIAEYVLSEWNTNRFLSNYQQLYRASVQYKEGNTDYYLPPGLAPLIKDKVSGLDAVVRVADGIGNGVIQYNTSKGSESAVFREENIQYTDSNFLKVFPFPIVAGSPSLSAPGTAALSEKMSKKIFGNESAVGKTITVSNQFGNTLYTVNAVFKDMANASDLKANVLLSLQTLENKAARDENDWADPATMESGFSHLYFLLNKNADADKVAQNITDIYRAAKPGTKSDAVLLQPFKYLHLAPSFSYPFQTFGSLVMVVVFSSVALLILIIAWFNYINLSTTIALKSAKEVGVRKVLGASRLQIAAQFLTETYLITGCSILLALFITQQCQPFINAFIGKNLSLSLLRNWRFLSIGCVLLLAVSFLSGTYVAFMLSSFKPIKTMRGQVDAVVKGVSLRKGLVVFQFTTSIVLIIGTVVLYKQLHYMQHAALGMNLDQLLVIKGPTVSSEGQAERNANFKEQLQSLSFVKKLSASNNVPGQGYNFSAEGITGTTPQTGDERKSYSILICDQNYFDTYGIPFAQGHAFSKEDAERSWNNIKKVIINEKAAQQLGFNLHEPIAGKKILWGEPYEVIGVVKDYHHLSLKESIKPTIYLGSVSFVYFTIKTDSHNMAGKLEVLRNLYNKQFAGNPFEYFFADESFGAQYSAEQKLGSLLIAAAATAIFIACLGLFGLASFSAQQRVKEIGIRKILGAGVQDIVLLLSRDFIRLIFFAILLSLPISLWAVHQWLQDFAYRTSVSWWLFVIAGAIALLIALGTIATQAVKAARKSPVKNLRAD